MSTSLRPAPEVLPSHPLLGPAPMALESAVGVYIHVPFCAHICPYCDFNTYSGQDGLIPRYVAALERELHDTSLALAGRRVDTIYFGGGTPSLLPAASVERLIQACRAAFMVSPDAEVSLEANPNGVDQPYFAALREAGVNRLSIGAQTFNRRGLRNLGRLHEAVDVLAAVAAARAAGFDNISLDFIFGWPGQTLESWRQDLESVIAMPAEQAVSHLSLYSLIVEPGTPMADAVARGIVHVADDDLGADLYELAMESLETAGFEHYEVANWARDRYYESRHNRIYWLNGEYAGIGAGAHGHLAGRRTMNHLLPATYCASIAAGQGPRSNVEEITTTMAMGETMMLGLRLLRDGVGDDAFLARHGVRLDDVYGSLIEQLATVGLIERAPVAMRLTRQGLMLANEVCAQFLIDETEDRRQ